jgi:hypothetical protein
MNDTEVLALLIYANELDGRHAPNEAKVYAWQEVLEENAQGMPLDFAKDVVKKHYAIHETMLSPSAVVRAWKDAKRMRAEARMALQESNIDAHCDRQGCLCTHEADCYKGWIDGKDTHRTVPCPICRASLSEVLNKIAPLGMRTANDMAMIRNRDKDHA